MSWVSLAVLFAVGAGARWFAGADHNIQEDSFLLLESARHLLRTGQYLVPSVGEVDGLLHWSSPSWPIGYPLMLAGLFKVFGPTESVARLGTIACSGLLSPLTAYFTFQFSGRRPLALIAGALAALHPLGIAFGGQLFTNNLSVTLYAGSLCATAVATVRRDREGFVPFAELALDAARRRALVAAALLFGFMLSVRDTDVLLGGPLLYMVYRSGVFSRAIGDMWHASVGVVAIAAMALLVGWTPSLYSNFRVFGSPLVSTHYQTGIRLSGSYLVSGSNFFFGLPGIAVMVVAIAACQLPALFAVPALGSARPLVKDVAVMTGLLALPMLLVNGAFPVASTGAAPRYVLPLVPFACLFGATAIERAWSRPRHAAAAIVAAVVIGWNAFMLYPPPVLFRIWSGFAYLTYYSPAYVARPYHNYPDHTNAMVRWVTTHTPEDALIVTPSQASHFFVYGHRAVCVLDTLTVGDWNSHVSRRPVFLVEDKNLALHPEVISSLRGRLSEGGLQLAGVGDIEVFTPEAGLTTVRVYRVEPVVSKTAS
ncbi:MAG: hypothetical protein HY047_00665 [Acidobacteria bacterium]|nr:hypothetical protein [Acidobacteriota bacterium]